MVVVPASTGADSGGLLALRPNCRDDTAMPSLLERTVNKGGTVVDDDDDDDDEEEDEDEALVVSSEV